MKRKHTLRNLLSMVCVIAMIISMVPVLPAMAAETVGSAQAGGVINFVDANEIVNTEAVAITAGMGLFAGTTEGKFDPAGTVTRAQMATIIVKMLRGNDFNADNFKGINKFSDTAGYQGGWAEGYINACVQMGVVAGYGDGTFKPDKAVTTAEALTMIINALKVDAGAGQWPNTIMAKAQEMKLYGDLAVKPGTYDALTRDQLAVLAYEGLCYSPSNVSGYKVPGSDIVFTDVADALKVCGDPSLITEVVGEDALANKIYELKVFEGFVTANQATGDNEFTTVTAYNADGTTAPVSMDFNMETGLAEIGHYVTVYYREEYKNEKEPGAVYNYVDETQVVTVDEDITTSKKYKEAFGKTIKEAALINGSDAVLQLTGNYIPSAAGNAARGSIAGYTEGTAAKAGTYLINDGVVKAYMAPVPVYAAQVRAINTMEGNETIELSGVPISNSEANDCVREYEGIAKDDYVTYTVVGTGANAIYVLTKATTTTGIITKTATNEDGDSVITVDGVDYVKFGGTIKITEFQGQTLADVNYTDSYTIVIAEDGKYIGYEKASGGYDLSATVFILGELVVTTDDGFGGKIRKTFARGIDMSGVEVLLPVKVEKNGVLQNGAYINGEEISDPECDPVTANTFYTYKLSTNKAAREEAICVLDAYPTAYDEKTAPVYSGTRSIGDGKTYAFTNFNDITGNNLMTYKSDNAVLLLLEGDVNQTTPLDATIKEKWDTSTNTTGETMYHYYLLSRNSTGSQMLDVAVVMVGNALSATGTEVVYVTQENTVPAAINSRGYIYDVYDYITGDAIQITLKANDPMLGANGVIPQAGYWHTIPEADGVYRVLDSRVGASGTFNQSASNSPSGDRLYAENILYNQLFVELMNNELTTTDMTRGQKATTAVVLDVRSEEKIAAMGVGKITSVDRISTLALDHPEIKVLFDMSYSTANKKMLTVFVTDAYFASLPGGVEIKVEDGVYYLDGRVVADNVVITDETDNLGGNTMANLLAQSNATTVSLSYEMTNGKVTAITVTDVPMPGQLRYEGFETYAEGSLGAAWPGSIIKNADQGGTYAHSIVTEGGSKAFKVALTGSGSKSWTGFKSPVYGDYVFEVRFMLGEDCDASSRFGVRPYTLKHTQTTANYAADGNYAVCVYGDGKVYMTDNTNSTSVATLSKNTWYKVVLSVSETAGKVKAEIFNDGGSTPIVSNETVVKGFGANKHQAMFHTNNAGTYYVDDLRIKELAVDTYSVKTSKVQNGVITPDMTEGVGAGQTVTLNIETLKGYKPESITVSGAEAGTLEKVGDTSYTYTFTMPAQNVTVDAVIREIGKNKVTVIQPASGGTIKVYADGVLVEKDVNDIIVEDAVLTFEAELDDPDASIDFRVDGGIIETDTYVMPNKAVEITADVIEVATLYKVNVKQLASSSADIKVYAGETLVNDGDMVKENTELTVKTDATGHAFKYLVLDGKKVEGSSFKLTQDVTVAAVYRPDVKFNNDWAEYFHGFDNYNVGDQITLGTTSTYIRDAAGTINRETVSIVAAEEDGESVMKISRPSSMAAWLCTGANMPVQDCVFETRLKVGANFTGDIGFGHNNLKDSNGTRIKFEMHADGTIKCIDTEIDNDGSNWTSGWVTVRIEVSTTNGTVKATFTTDSGDVLAETLLQGTTFTSQKFNWNNDNASGDVYYDYIAVTPMQ